MKLIIAFNKPEELRTGSSVWRVAVEHAVHDLIQHENKRAPLDDGAISRMLGDQGYRGVSIHYVRQARKGAGIDQYKARQVGKCHTDLVNAKARKAGKQQ